MDGKNVRLNFVKKFCGEKHESVIDWTSVRYEFILSFVVIGAIDDIIKCKRGNGTKFVWNSFKSTFNSPPKRNDAVIDDIVFVINLFKFEYDGCRISNHFEHISYIASLSNINDTSVWSNNQWVVNNELYGSTTHVEWTGDG